MDSVEGFDWPAAPSWVVNEAAGEAGYCEETRTHVMCWRGPYLALSIDQARHMRDTLSEAIADAEQVDATV